MSLRHRLMAGFVALAALLLAADVLLYRTVVDSLVAAVDERLGAGGPGAGGPGGGFRRPESGGPFGASQGTVPPPAGSRESSTPFTFPDITPQVLERVPGGDQLLLQVRRADGSLDVTLAPPLEADSSPPAIDDDTVIAMAGSADAPLKPFTASPSDGSGPSYRVSVMRLRDGDGYFVRGISLAETDATARRILALEGGATGIVLVGFALVAWYVIRLGLRPINVMAATALAIADGDLERAIPPSHPATEAGELADALNRMLGRLREALAEEARSGDQLRQFVADASHELRTPLTSIRGYTELLRSGELDVGDESEDALRRLDHEAHRMSELVDELLLLARLDQGRPLETGAVDLARLVRDAVTDLQVVQPERPVTVTTTPVDGPAPVAGDPARLRQIVDNLLANVRTHTPATSTVDISVTSGEADVELVVADRGPGFTPGSEAHVFERFYRDDPARSGPGTGLGLAIVAAIVAAHGGEVGAVNRTGGGAEIHVRLPIAGGSALPFGTSGQDR